MIDEKRLNHYRTYMKIYGSMIMELADHDEEVIKLITSEHTRGLFTVLRELIEDSPFYEK